MGFLLNLANALQLGAGQQTVTVHYDGRFDALQLGAGQQTVTVPYDGRFGGSYNAETGQWIGDAGPMGPITEPTFVWPTIYKPASRWAAAQVDPRYAAFVAAYPFPGGDAELRRYWEAGITSPEWARLQASAPASLDPVWQWYRENPTAFGQYVLRWGPGDYQHGTVFRYTPEEFAAAAGAPGVAPQLGAAFQSQQSAAAQAARDPGSDLADILPFALLGGALAVVAAPALTGAAVSAVGAEAATVPAWAPSLAGTTFNTAIPAAAAASEAATLAAAGYTAAEMAQLGLSASAIAAGAPSLDSVVNLASDFASTPTPPASLFQPQAPALGSGIPPPPQGLTLSPSGAVPSTTGASSMDLSTFLDYAGTDSWGVGIDPFAPSPGSDFLLTSSTGGVPLDTFYDLGLGGMTESGALRSGGSLSDIFGQIGNAVKSAAGVAKTVLGARQQTATRPAPTVTMRAGNSNVLGLLLLGVAGYFALKG